MNRKTDSESRLLAESYHGNWADGPTADFARTAARHARRRRAMRTTLASTAAIAVAIGAWFIASPDATSLSPTPPVAHAPPRSDRGYEIISDDELLRQLRDRPVLVVGHENGRREITVLEN